MNLNWITGLMGYKNFLVGVALSLIVGFGSGMYVDTMFQKSAAFDANKTTDKQSTKSIAISNGVEKEMLQHKEAAEIHYKTITKEIIKYVPQTTTRFCKADNGDDIATTLNVGAVELLNSSKEDPIVQSADGTAFKAPTEVGLRELSDYITVIKKQYDDLAIEHDGLIDYNDEYSILISK